MGLVREFRSSIENPSTPLSFPAEWLLDLFNGGRTDSGIRVSEMTALQVSTVFACVQLISSAMGFLDLKVYERKIDQDKGRTTHRVAYEHDLFDLLEHEPNPEMTSFTFRKTLQAHALLWGNLYAEIQRDNGNRAVALWPRNPARIRPYRLTADFKYRGDLIRAGEMVYKTTEGTEQASVNPDSEDYQPGPDRIIPREDVVHIPGLALDGRIGQSVVQLSRQAIGLALATEKFGAKFFGNGARPGGTLEHPGTLKPEARENLKRSWKEAHGGENAHGVAVLEEGLKFSAISVKPNESQFLETRQYQKSDICSIFGVPPHMVGDTEKTNRANTEQIGIEFVTFGLSAWITSWQQELKRKLLPSPSYGRNAGKVYVAKFDTRPLIMPDAESRRNFYASGKQWGYLTTNIILGYEGIDPVDDPSADGFWMPINMQDMARAYQEPAQGPGPADPIADGGQADDEGKNDKLGKRFTRAYFRVFRDAFGRVLTRSQADSEVFRRTFLPVFLTIGEELDQLASEEFGSETSSDLEHSKFLTDYIDGMRSRFEEWKASNGDRDRIAERELARAIRAISIEVYRSVATRKAKVLTEA